jgi:hypothetical protein
MAYAKLEGWEQYMKRETIDDDVWEFIAQKYGRFGDTWCDALRRGLGIPISQDAEAKPDRRNRIAERRLSREIADKKIAFRFDIDPWRIWKLPANKGDKQEVRRIRDEALAFGRANGATPGQLNAIGKMFSDAGYYLTGPHP